MGVSVLVKDRFHNAFGIPCIGDIVSQHQCSLLAQLGFDESAGLKAGIFEVATSRIDESAQDSFAMGDLDAKPHSESAEDLGGADENGLREQHTQLVEPASLIVQDQQEETTPIDSDLACVSRWIYRKLLELMIEVGEPISKDVMSLVRL